MYLNVWQYTYIYIDAQTIHKALRHFTLALNSSISGAAPIRPVPCVADDAVLLRATPPEELFAEVGEEAIWIAYMHMHVYICIYTCICMLLSIYLSTYPAIYLSITVVAFLARLFFKLDDGF